MNQKSPSSPKNIFWDPVYTPAEMEMFAEKFENENQLFSLQEHSSFFSRFGFAIVAVLISILFSVVSAQIVLNELFVGWIFLLVICIFGVFFLKDQSDKNIEKKNWILFFENLQNFCRDVFFLTRNHDTAFIRHNYHNTAHHNQPNETAEFLMMEEKTGGGHWKRLSLQENFFCKGEKNQRITDEIWVQHQNCSVYFGNFLYETETHSDKGTQTHYYNENFVMMPCQKPTVFELIRENFASDILKNPFLGSILQIVFAILVPLQIGVLLFALFEANAHTPFLVAFSLGISLFLGLIFLFFRKTIGEISQHSPAFLVEIPTFIFVVFGIVNILVFQSIPLHSIEWVWAMVLSGFKTFFLLVSIHQIAHWSKVMQQDVQLESSAFNALFRVQHAKRPHEENAEVHFLATQFLTPKMQEIIVALHNAVNIQEIFFREKFVLIAMGESVEKFFAFPKKTKTQQSEATEMMKIFERLALFFAFQKGLSSELYK